MFTGISWTYRESICFGNESEEFRFLKWSFSLAKASLHFPAACNLSAFLAEGLMTAGAHLILCLPWLFSFFLSLQTWTQTLRPCLLFLSTFPKQRLCWVLFSLGIRPVGDGMKLLLIPRHLGLASVGLQGNLGASFCMQCDQNTFQMPALWESVGNLSWDGSVGVWKPSPPSQTEVSIYTTHGFEHLLESAQCPENPKRSKTSDLMELNTLWQVQICR